MYTDTEWHNEVERILCRCFLKIEDWEGDGGLVLYLDECGKFLLCIFYFKIVT